MDRADVDRLIDVALRDRHLLTHIFYRRWEAGEVTMTELAVYAAQYRHFEAALPTLLADLEGALPDGQARDCVATNLADELGDPIPHLELFDRFAHAVGATSQPPTAATAALLATYRELICRDASLGLAGFLAYESQAAEVAAAKASGLRHRYGLSETAVSFWEHHAEVDGRHDGWLRDAMAAVSGDPKEVLHAVRLAADAWWAFLDEREAAATAA